MYYLHFSVNAIAAERARRTIERDVDRYERYRVSHSVHFLFYITEDGYERIIDSLEKILSFKIVSLLPVERRSPHK